eukprot:ctg_1311.g448
MALWQTLGRAPGGVCGVLRWWHGRVACRGVAEVAAAERAASRRLGVDALPSGSGGAADAASAKTSGANGSVDNEKQLRAARSPPSPSSWDGVARPSLPRNRFERLTASLWGGDASASSTATDSSFSATEQEDISSASVVDGSMDAECAGPPLPALGAELDALANVRVVSNSRGHAYRRLYVAGASSSSPAGMDAASAGSRQARLLEAVRSDVRHDDDDLVLDWRVLDYPSGADELQPVLPRRASAAVHADATIQLHALLAGDPAAAGDRLGAHSALHARLSRRGAARGGASRRRPLQSVHLVDDRRADRPLSRGERLPRPVSGRSECLFPAAGALLYAARAPTGERRVAAAPGADQRGRQQNGAVRGDHTDGPRAQHRAHAHHGTAAVLSKAAPRAGGGGGRTLLATGLQLLARGRLFVARAAGLSTSAHRRAVRPEDARRRPHPLGPGQLPRPPGVPHHQVVRPDVLYCFQLRVGRMSGAFITYHNTRECFGFEYVSLAEMERYVFGSAAWARQSFFACMGLFAQVLQRAVDPWRDADGQMREPVKLTVEPTRQRGQLRVYLQRLRLTERGEHDPLSPDRLLQWSAAPGNCSATELADAVLGPPGAGHTADAEASFVQDGDLRAYTLHVAPCVNGSRIVHDAVDFRAGDVYDLLYAFSPLESPLPIASYVTALRRSYGIDDMPRLRPVD